ncbi:DUF7848 domain-containing protein [Streptomyces sp. NPDC002514]|uniref:DUF7848 domain-containing protein n=1 Tax=Streptomyces sp. NPDC001270 TaxID=3364554 RepID=UPI00369920C5
MTTPARRRRFVFVDWRLRPDLDDDAPPLIYVLRCRALRDDGSECAAQSPPSEDPAQPQTWAFTHLRERPEHTGYTEVIERPWVMGREGPT